MLQPFRVAIAEHMSAAVVTDDGQLYASDQIQGQRCPHNHATFARLESCNGEPHIGNIQLDQSALQIRPYAIVAPERTIWIITLLNGEQVWVVRSPICILPSVTSL